MIIKLQDLKGSTFRFLIKDKFRGYLFTILKEKYKDWKTVAKELDINNRNLFGIRRGWELKGKDRIPRYLSYQTLENISTKTKVSLDKIGRNIFSIKCGPSGRSSKISMPLIAELKELKIKSVESALFDYKFSIAYLDLLKSTHNKPSKKYYKLKNLELKKYIKMLKIRGLNPSLSNESLSYRIPGTNKRKTIVVQKEFTFDEIFAKEFGKWMGDRCGGSRKIGVANKNFEFTKSFGNFLASDLKQQVDFYLTVNKKAKLNAINPLLSKVVQSNTQIGDYAYRAETSNAFLRRTLFDHIEENILEILEKSIPLVRYSYYAGLIEAEGSINQDETISIAFGLKLKKKRKYQKYLEKLEESLRLFYLLELDGFNPRLSRKCSKETIKYDINLLNYSKDRKKEINFINRTIRPFITHNVKLSKFEQLLWRYTHKEDEKE